LDEDACERLRVKVGVSVSGHGHPAALAGMRELTVAADLGDLLPPILGQ
jgi:hypothetical protein